MKQLYVSLIAVFFLFPLSAAAGGVPWGEPNNTPGGRFIELSSYNNEAVFDSETGLVWEQSPSTTLQTWENAQFSCNQKTVGNRKGWRLPTVQELASLVDPTVPPPGPTLPAGHPFSNVRSDFYWSATTFARSASDAWVVSFSGANVVTFAGKSFTTFVWCVRGGQGVDPQ
jgi:uncharacterized protein DUF1566